LRAVVAVFAKAPRPGEVKTRLTPPLEPELAAAFYAAMLDDVLRETVRAGTRFGFDVALVGHPEEALPEFRAGAPRGLRVIAQRGDSLGARLAAAVQELFALGHAPIVVRGSDSPAVSAADLASAVDSLEGTDVVIGPDRDGGYHLLGVRRPAPRLFELPMSTSDVLVATERRALELGLDCRRLAPGFDIDTIEDLRFLLDLPDSAPCSATLAFARRHDLWRHLA
jgi:rSAM/selenodomain-associated transferase 1